MTKSPEVVIRVVRNGYIAQAKGGDEYDSACVFNTFEELMVYLKGNLLQDTADVVGAVASNAV